MRPVALEILEDLTPPPGPSLGFLTVRRLRLRHTYEDGTHSPPYSCDVVSRPGTDAVAVVLWFRGEDGRPRVVLKEGVRPPVWLRRCKDLIRPDPQAPLCLIELVAGILEPGDGGPDGLSRRGAAEAREEAGVELSPDELVPLGGPSFPTPGAADERVDFLVAELPGPPPAARPRGDGSAMEHGTTVVVLDLEEAIARCRDGRIPDMKTEIGLTRLAARLAGDV
ncbi:MAG: NUDIX hydrolase [Planctomycetota bacterium]|nr:MAG: NUDIX hydrolase [Planctomycetota bacterium]